MIRQTAHEALDDLKRIIGVLRGTGESPGGRQSVEGIAELVHGAREAGTPISLTFDLAPGDVGASSSQAAYRVVQEALTNAQKHARGAPVAVALHGTVHGGIRVRVRNHATDASPSPHGSGTGLRGLDEQVRAVGGTFDARPVPGEFLVDAWLPWHA